MYLIFLEDFDRLERPHIEPKKFKKLCVLEKPGGREAKDLDLFSALMWLGKCNK